MIRTGTLAVVLAVALGGAVVGPSHVAGQTDDRALTVDLDGIDGATVCVQQLTPETNRVVVRSGGENVTIYLDETRRVELGETRSSAGAIVLRTDRRNETLNDLAAAEECFAAQRTDVVVDVRSVELRNLAVTGYGVEVGPQSDIPAPVPFDPPYESDGQGGTGDNRSNETDHRGNETDHQDNETDHRGNETDNQGNEMDPRPGENDRQGNESDSDHRDDERDGSSGDSTDDSPSDGSEGKRANPDSDRTEPTTPSDTDDTGDTETPARERATRDVTGDERALEP
ncbi:hypothetical protein [Natrinema altunense]|uniref:Uncharacterized protein n=1 Tax=Natrinema altunense TaxID=222984 RepID=A0A482Y331_9EURY|nr:hypothetical protein [Natrinema altunense]RZH67147.1 hypothetical protein ELS17_15425 [Natrinema altunense]